MMLVNFGSGIVLNPDHVVSVCRDFYEKFLIITDVLGNRHEISRQYGEDIRDAEKRVIAMLTPVEEKRTTE